MFETRMTWEKLKLELDMLGAENPNSLIPLLLGLNSYLWPEESFEKIHRELNFMNYEVAQLCEGLCEEDRRLVLNNYFFETKGFSAAPLNQQGVNETHLLMGSFLKFRCGHPLVLAIMYCHFATLLDLPIYLTSPQHLHVLKWVRGMGKMEFLSLLTNGQTLSTDDLLKIYNQTTKEDLDSLNLDILPSKVIFSMYLETLLEVYFSRADLENELNVLNVIIGLHPSRLKHLSRRALIYKELGHHKEALSDLKRYFSFIDRSSAAPEIKMAYYELQAFQSSQDQIKPTILH